MVAYGQILPQKLIDAPRWGSVNLHASLLPRWRGAAPVHWAVAKGDTETGVCVQRMVKALDAGDVMMNKKVPVGVHTTEALLRILAEEGAKLLVEAVKEMPEILERAKPQDESLVTYASLLKKEDGFLDFSMSAADVAQMGRAFSIQPGCRAVWQPHKMELRLFGFEAVEGKGQPGEILGIEKGCWKVACGSEAVLIKEVQAAGKRRLSAEEFLRGMPKVQPGRLVKVSGDGIA